MIIYYITELISDIEQGLKSYERLLIKMCHLLRKTKLYHKETMSMCNFYIYGKIPTDRNNLKIKFTDIKSKTIKDLSISEILRINKIKTQDIEELIVMVADDKFNISLVDTSVFYQSIDNVEIFRLHDYIDSKYEYFIDDILIQNSMYTISLINEIISSNCKYFAICIKYIDKRKIKLKKMNDKIIEDINHKI